MRPALVRSLDALEGLSVGDSFGEQFFGDPAHVQGTIKRREVPSGRWRWTDDTAMALGVVAVLHQHGSVIQDAVAATFGEDYRNDPRRGYGPGMHRLLSNYKEGPEWRWLASEQFGGQGSFGNGAAMRAAPLGAFFADDLDATATQAALSAAVTHAHPEGIAGAVAVALAAALVCSEPTMVGPALLDAVYRRVPDGEVRHGIRRARDLNPAATATDAASMLGSGHEVSAQDTVPFCLWCVAKSADDYEEALWLTVQGLGDRDTTCAIVGGIVGARVGPEAIPLPWRRAREQLPSWVAQLRSEVEP